MRFIFAACSLSTDLDAVSKLRFSAFQNRFFKNFEGMYYSRCDGILTPELWGEIERTMSDFLAYHGVHQWWETRRHWHTEEFRRVVDAIIARGDEPKAYSTYNLREIAAPGHPHELISRAYIGRARLRRAAKPFGANPSFHEIPILHL